LKVQMLLVALMLAAAALGILFPPGLLLAFLILALFLLTTLPFIAKAWPKDVKLALVSPIPLFVRALALGLGYFWGVIRPLPNIKEHPAPTQ